MCHIKDCSLAFSLGFYCYLDPLLPQSVCQTTAGTFWVDAMLFVCACACSCCIFHCLVVWPRGSHPILISHATCVKHTHTHARIHTHTHAVLSLLCAYLTCAKSFSWEKINKPLDMCHLTRTDPNMTALTINTHILPSTTDVSCDSVLHFSILMYYMVLLRQSWYYKSEINMTG